MGPRWRLDSDIAVFTGAVFLTLGLERIANALWLNPGLALSARLLMGSGFLVAGVLTFVARAAARRHR
jgi:hypothetical protein